EYKEQKTSHGHGKLSDQKKILHKKMCGITRRVRRRNLSAKGRLPINAVRQPVNAGTPTQPFGERLPTCK
ncbi:MAG: hypothetical protein LBT09_06385, partial [Planctomycetaceae bacterium]|nr:hypothetical protein [Planctomycetaceae bacterium]